MTSALYILLILESNHTCAPRVESSMTNDSARLNSFIETPRGRITNNLRFDLLHRYLGVATGGLRPLSVVMRNEANSSSQFSCLRQYLCSLTSSFLIHVWISVSIDSYSNEWLPPMDEICIPTRLRKMTSLMDKDTVVDMKTESYYKLHFYCDACWALSPRCNPVVPM